MQDTRYVTADGKAIVDGGRYYNYYDCEWVTVSFGNGGLCDPGGEYWDGWFLTRGDDGSRRILNGERMSTVQR